MAVFTNQFLKGLKPSNQRYEERDAGCPGLLVRVNANGTKVWEVIAVQGRRRRRIRLGKFPDVSLAMARRMAAERKSAPEMHSQAMKVADLFDIYEREASVTRRSFKDVRGSWDKWADPMIGGVRLDDLTMRHGANLISHISKHSSPNRARKVIRNLSPMLNFAAGRGIIPGNPWSGLHLPAGVERRDRVLSRNEWSKVWSWTQSEDYPWGPFLAALMLSAQRLSEVAKMQWKELDGDIWTIPAERHKSKKFHEVPLSHALQRLIEGQPRHDEYVFSTMQGRAVVPGTKLRKRIFEETETTDWRYHDIRRTGATCMGDGGVNRFIIERVLGHADHTVTAIYDRATYRIEKREALEVLARMCGDAQD